MNYALVVGGVLAACLVGAAEAHTVTVGGMPIHYAVETAPVDVTKIFQEFRAQQRAQESLRMQATVTSDRVMLRLARGDSASVVSSAN